MDFAGRKRNCLPVPLSVGYLLANAFGVRRSSGVRQLPDYGEPGERLPRRSFRRRRVGR
jgi:hypothetical protein